MRYMYTVIHTISASLKKNLSFCLIFIWMLTTSQQCSDTITDACGSYVTKPNVIKIILTLNTGIPNGRPRPIVQTVGGINNVINIQGSLYYINPTIFGLKSETYAMCNGIPRYKTSCCVSTANSCLPVENQTPYELNMIYQGAFKSKITVRALSLVSNYSTYDLYEGSFDIDATTGTPPSVVYCNLTYKRMYYSSNIPPSYLCDYNE